jgi:hypothetical protein
MGFLRQAPPGSASHRFFFTYDGRTDSWIKLDVVTELAYGPSFSLRTRAEEGCLARRQERGVVAILAPDDAFWTLLLHGLLDKQTLGEKRSARLHALAGAARTDGQLAGIVEEVCPVGWTAERVIRAVRSQDWRALANLAPVLTDAWIRKEGVRGRWRIRVRKRMSTTRLLQLFAGPGISIALLGPDGAGKSTLASGISRSFYFPVKCIYMGLWSLDPDRRSRLENVRGFAWATRVLRSWWRYAVARL